MTEVNIVEHGEDHKGRVAYFLAVAQHRGRVEAEITPAWWNSPRRSERILSITLSRIGLVPLETPVSLSSPSSTPETEAPGDGDCHSQGIHPIPGPLENRFALLIPSHPISLSPYSALSRAQRLATSHLVRH